jgi:hypothetical protein
MDEANNLFRDFGNGRSPKSGEMAVGEIGDR